MKRIAGSSFWKIYLTLLFVHVLPIILFTLSHIIQDRDKDMPMPKVMLHLEWSASELAAQAESIAPELLTSWIEHVKEVSGLIVCIQRNGSNFHLPEGEWLVSHEANEEIFPPRPFAVSFSPSGRTKAAVSLQLRDEGGHSRLRKRNSWVFFSVAILCAAFSFILVQNLMNPLLELRRTTLKLANGDLSVRVGQTVIGRSDEIADLGKSFNKMAERVETLVSSQKRLLSDISHEIRSPLQRMEVASALLRDKSFGDKPDLRKYVDRVETEISRIDGMVEELLTLTRADEPSLVQSEIVRLDEIINLIIEDAEFENENEVKKKIVTSNLQELSVLGDETLLSRALRNVIHNAIRYTAPGTEVEVGASRDENDAVVTIRDHGQGVSEKDLEKIFLPYYRTDKARERSQGGVGLGLSITKRIVENHGGNVTAANASEGLLVTIRLPLLQCS